MPPLIVGWQRVNSGHRRVELGSESPDGALLCWLEHVEGFCCYGGNACEPNQEVTSLKQVACSLDTNPLPQLVEVRLLSLLESHPRVIRRENVILALKVSERHTLKEFQVRFSFFLLNPAEQRVWVPSGNRTPDSLRHRPGHVELPVMHERRWSP